MRKKVLKLNKKPSKKWAADEDKWPSSTVWVKRGSREWRQVVHDPINFNINQFSDHEEDFEGRDSSMLQDTAVLNFTVQRQRVQVRRRPGEYWQKLEWRLPDIFSGCGIPLCACSARAIVDVRHIDLGHTYINLEYLAITKHHTMYYLKRVSYYICGSVITQLLQDSSFCPFTPVKPGAVFTMRFLRLFDYQCVQGATSKFPWAQGWCEFFEEELGWIIPSLHGSVCIPHYCWD